MGRQLPPLWLCRGWLVPAIWLEGFVIFLLFCCHFLLLHPMQSQAVPAVPCIMLSLWYNQGLDTGCCLGSGQ